MQARVMQARTCMPDPGLEAHVRTRASRAFTRSTTLDASAGSAAACNMIERQRVDVMKGQ